MQVRVAPTFPSRSPGHETVASLPVWALFSVATFDCSSVALTFAVVKLNEQALSEAAARRAAAGRANFFMV